MTLPRNGRNSRNSLSAAASRSESVRSARRDHRSPQRRRRIHSADNSSTISANAHGSCHRSRRSGGVLRPRGRLQPRRHPCGLGGADVAAAGGARDRGAGILRSAAGRRTRDPRRRRTSSGRRLPSGVVPRRASAWTRYRPACSGRNGRGEPAAGGVGVAKLDRRRCRRRARSASRRPIASGTGANGGVARVDVDRNGVARLGRLGHA